MKRMIPPLIAYLVVCVIILFIPASEGYNTVGWKLFVGQIYAIPVFIFVALIVYFVNRNKSNKRKE